MIHVLDYIIPGHRRRRTELAQAVEGKRESRAERDAERDRLDRALDDMMRTVIDASRKINGRT